jgi:GR25 family glycosyltransferase involved in LPS biosynthesis
MSGHCDCLPSSNTCSEISESYIEISVNGWLTQYPLLGGRYQCHRTLCDVAHGYKDGVDAVVLADEPAFPGTELGLFRVLVQLENLQRDNYLANRASADISVSYRQPADVVISYIYDEPQHYAQPCLAFHEKRNAAALFASHCGVGFRESIITELQHIISIDSFGSCQRTANVRDTLPQCLDFVPNATTRYFEKECVLYHYKFSLAMENSEDDGYVTEKLWQALKMGSVPIYWGAKNVREFLPSKESVIDVRDFPDVRSLGNYLLHLMHNETAYNEHLRWRQVDFSKQFLSQFSHSMSTMFCDICESVARRKAHLQCFNDLMQRNTSLQAIGHSGEAAKLRKIDAIYVTNYSPLVERLQLMDAFLKNLHVSGKAILTFDASNLNMKDLECMNPFNHSDLGHRSWLMERKLTDGEISLFVKHFRALYDVIQSNFSAALVFEDDAYVFPRYEMNFKRVLTYVMMKVPSDYDLLFLGGCADATCSFSRFSRTFQVKVEPGRPYVGTHAYIVSRQGALKMMKTLPMRWPYDNQIDLFALNVFHTEPPLFGQRWAQLGSSLSHARTTARNESLNPNEVWS